MRCSLTVLAALAVCFAVLFPASSSAQGIYVLNGTNGFGLSGGVLIDAQNADVFASYAGAGVSLDGQIDLGIGYSRSMGSSPVTVSTLTPYINLFLKKAIPEDPVSAFMGLSIIHARVRSQDASFGGSTSASSADLGVSANLSYDLAARPARHAVLSVGVSAIPTTDQDVKDTVTVTFATGFGVITGPSGASILETSMHLGQANSFGIGGSFVIR